MIAKLRSRKQCHGSIACCQYCDQPMCNSYSDPHLLWRLHWRLTHKWLMWKERS